LSPLVVAPAADEASILVALVAVVDCPTNAAHVALWTTSYLPADDALLKWTLTKRKWTLIIQKYGTPVAGSASAHAALLSDVLTDEPDSHPTLEECTDEFYDIEVSVPFTSVAFSSSLAPGRDLSQFSVVDSACSINLTAFRHDFVTFDLPSTPSRVGGVGVDIKGSGDVRLSILLA
jgi:hypothetical protein